MAGFHPRIALDQTEGALDNGALLLAAPARDLSDMPVPVPLSEAARIAPPTLASEACGVLFLAWPGF